MMIARTKHAKRAIDLTRASLCALLVTLAIYVLAVVIWWNFIDPINEILNTILLGVINALSVAVVLLAALALWIYVTRYLMYTEADDACRIDRSVMKIFKDFYEAAARRPMDDNVRYVEIRSLQRAKKNGGPDAINQWGEDYLMRYGRRELSDAV